MPYRFKPKPFTFKDVDDEYRTLEKMEEMGGSFVKILAKLYRAGDGINKGKLRNTFGQYFRTYQKEASL